MCLRPNSKWFDKFEFSVPTCVGIYLALDTFAHSSVCLSVFSQLWIQSSISRLETHDSWVINRSYHPIKILNRYQELLIILINSTTSPMSYRFTVSCELHVGILLDSFHESVLPCLCNYRFMENVFKWTNIELLDCRPGGWGFCVIYQFIVMLSYLYLVKLF
jgi:hypothetical protein